MECSGIILLLFSFFLLLLLAFFALALYVFNKVACFRYTAFTQKPQHTNYISLWRTTGSEVGITSTFNLNLNGESPVRLCVTRAVIASTTVRCLVGLLFLLLFRPFVVFRVAVFLFRGLLLCVSADVFQFQSTRLRICKWTTHGSQ